MIEDIIIQLKQINYLDILNTIKPLIIFYAGTKTYNTYALHREYKPKNVSKVVLPPELTLEYNDIDTNKIAATKFGESIIEFANVMIKNFPTKDLINFYNNINELKVNPEKTGIQKLIFRNFYGMYNTMKNIITVDEEIYELTIYHELFHMASSVYKDGIAYSGFSQDSLKPTIVSLGKGINEGYTELLSQRYFIYNNHVAFSYKYLVHISEKLEQIVGKEEMQSLYLNSNLKGLIDELKQYISEEEIMKFISNTDFLIEHLDDNKLQLFKKNMISNSLKNINRFLIICYSKKLQQQFKDGKISTTDEMFQDLIQYISSLVDSIEIGKQKYEVMNDIDIKENVQSSFGNANIDIEIKKNK